MGAERRASIKMSSDENDVDSLASDREGEEDIVIEKDDEVNEDDEDNEEEETFKEKMNNLEWKTKPDRTRKKKKDRCSPSKLLFNPSNMIDCYRQFMSSELQDLIIKYTNMMGNNFLQLIYVLISSWFLV